jgi:hypothetical protein
MGAPAMAGLATGSRRIDSAGDQTGLGAAAGPSLAGRPRLSGDRRLDSYVAHPRALAELAARGIRGEPGRESGHRDVLAYELGARIVVEFTSRRRAVLDCAVIPTIEHEEETRLSGPVNAEQLRSLIVVT